MPVNLRVWNSALLSARSRLDSEERLLVDLAAQLAEQNRVVNAARDEVKHIEQLDADLTELLRARGETRL